MITIKLKEELLKKTAFYQANEKLIGFVPTMGFLHEGHLSLIKKAKENNDWVVCSIFVNPTQFNDPKDLLKYPRNLEKDKQMLEMAGCDILFCPEVEEMYPETTKKQLMHFDFGNLDKVMEGAKRPGHFQGVATIVYKLFELMQPCNAYFGEKDFQQVAIIRSMVKQKGLEVNIIPCPIVRERSGLAMSSRNQRLTNPQKETATLLYHSLLKVKSLVKTESINEAKSQIEEIFRESPMKLDYIDICDETTLEPVSDLKSLKQIRAFIAAYVGEVRLIDNMAIF